VDAVAPRKRRHKGRKRRTRQYRVARRRARRGLSCLARRRRWRGRPWWEQRYLELASLLARFPAEYGKWEAIRIGRALVLRGEVAVPTLPKRRRVAISFPGPPSRIRPIVMVSGPVSSRHRFTRYRPTSLCLYYGRDPKSMAWQLSDGLVGLIDLIRVHLFAEEWWRATSVWPRPEVHLDPPPTRTRTMPKSKRPKARLASAREPCWCGSGRYSRCHEALPASSERRLLSIEPDSPHASEVPAARD
jgi:hypothetical protein